MKHSVEAFIYPDNGGFVAECPGINAVTQGDTLDETLANVREVIALALESEDPADYDFAADPSIIVTTSLGRFLMPGQAVSIPYELAESH